MKMRYLRDRNGFIDKNYVIARDGSYIRDKVTGKKLDEESGDIYIYQEYRVVNMKINEKHYSHIKICHLQWLAWKGIIPEGYVIHHKKWNKDKKFNLKLKLNDDVANLSCMTRFEHLSVHNVGSNNPMWGKFGRKNPTFGIKKFVGRDNPFYKKHHSEETKKKISVAMSGENNPQAKLTSEKVEEVRRFSYIDGWSFRKIAKKFKVSRGCIQHIVQGRKWNSNKLSKDELIDQTLEAYKNFI
jgi:hypothetical protein